MVGDFVMKNRFGITNGYKRYKQGLNIDKDYKITYYVESDDGDLSQ